MKLITSTLICLFVSAAVFAQKKEEIKVWGNCGMCKKVIEEATLKAGAKKASWSEESKVLSVEYNERNTDLNKIQESIAASGYDTRDLTAPDEVYNKLHGCCQYERKSAVSKTEVSKDCCKDGKCEKDKSCCKDGKCEKGKECCKK